MSIPMTHDACLLRIFLSETARVDGHVAHEAIVREALRLKLAGATVLRGVLGFGKSAHLHSARLLSLSDDLPVVVEIVDSRENIERILPFVRQRVGGGLVTLEKAEVVHWAEDNQSGDDENNNSSDGSGAN